jgi:Pentapeptide repeats (8 copies)
MANQEQLAILHQGVEVWNKWRNENPDVEVNLIDANLRNVYLYRADLHEARLMNTNLTSAYLAGANLRNAILLSADLLSADLDGADLEGADLTEANLDNANLHYANLTGVMLERASLIYTKIEKAKISGSFVHGINVWDLKGEFEEQKDLIITRDRQPIITVDNIKVAQFIYLILNNEEIRNAINTLTSKSVLILGRFSIPERKGILDTLRNKLREYNLLPIVFDFDRPIDKDFTETIKTLAGLSYFVIADVTNPKSSPLELQATVPDYQIPFVPIIQEGESPFAMMVDLQKKYNWVLNTVTYDSMETLIKVLKPLIIDPAMEKRHELRLIKAQEPEIISAKDFLAKGKS